MMDDYISRQEAIDALFGITAYKNTVPVFSAVFNIQKIPAAPVREVKRGRWIHDGYDIPHGIDWMHCSECGRREPYVPAAMTDYCPTCGADMREGDMDDV